MDPTVIAVWIASAACLGTALSFLREKKRPTAPRFDIGSAPENQPIEIRGVIKHAGATLTSPIAERQCVAWAATAAEVAQYRGDSVHSTPHDVYQSVAARDHSIGDFTIEDATGRALVQGRGSNADVELRFRHYPKDRGQGPLGRLMAVRGKTAFDVVLWSDVLDYHEGSVVPGDEVTVVGSGHRETDPDPSAFGGDYRHRPTRLVLDRVLLVTNTTKR